MAQLGDAHWWCVVTRRQPPSQASPAWLASRSSRPYPTVSCTAVVPTVTSESRRTQAAATLRLDRVRGHHHAPRSCPTRPKGQSLVSLQVRPITRAPKLLLNVAALGNPDHAASVPFHPDQGADSLQSRGLARPSLAALSPLATPAMPAQPASLPDRRLRRCQAITRLVRRNRQTAAATASRPCSLQGGLSLQQAPSRCCSEACCSETHAT